MLFSHNVSILLPLCGPSSIHLLMATGFYGVCSLRNSDPPTEFWSGKILTADHRNILKLCVFNMWQCWRRKQCFESCRAGPGDRGNLPDQKAIIQAPLHCVRLRLGIYQIGGAWEHVYSYVRPVSSPHWAYLAMRCSQMVIDSSGKSLWCDSVCN